jgi:preprotein translocase subunit SecG
MNIYLYYAILVVHVFACLFLIGVVLLQQGKGQDLASAFGGGVTQTAFGPRGSANVLSRMTTILAGVFMVTSLSLSVLRPQAGGGFMQELPAAAPAPAPAPGASPQSSAPGASPAAPADSSSTAPSNAAPAPAEVPGKDRPLTDKDVGPNAK